MAEKLNLKSTRKIVSGYEIPILGYGVSDANSSKTNLLAVRLLIETLS
jgi:hypothetical protein